MEIVAEEAKMSGKVILLLDEVHRLDKAKQDFLLPYLENGMIILIGATTSNPYHAINPAIRSRCQIFELKSLTPDDIKMALTRALNDSSNGFGDRKIVVEDDAMNHFANSCNGDVRSALNALELAVLSTSESDGKIVITLQTAEECLQQKYFSHDKMVTLTMMYYRLFKNRFAGAT